jgi:hypothetical protein
MVHVSSNFVLDGLIPHSFYTSEAKSVIERNRLIWVRNMYYCFVIPIAIVYQHLVVSCRMQGTLNFL